MESPPPPSSSQVKTSREHSARKKWQIPNGKSKSNKYLMGKHYWRGHHKNKSQANWVSKSRTSQSASQSVSHSFSRSICQTVSRAATLGNGKSPIWFDEIQAKSWTAANKCMHSGTANQPNDDSLFRCCTFSSRPGLVWSGLVCSFLAWPLKTAYWLTDNATCTRVFHHRLVSAMELPFAAAFQLTHLCNSQIGINIYIISCGWASGRAANTITP